MTTITFEVLSCFSDDIKHLRKFRHLEEDIEVLKKALAVNPTRISGVEKIAEKHRKFQDNMYKVTKFHSRDIPNKGCRSGFRIIYHYEESTQTITLIEVYHHNEKEECDKKRLERLYPLA